MGGGNEIFSHLQEMMGGGDCCGYWGRGDCGDGSGCDEDGVSMLAGIVF